MKTSYPTDDYYLYYSGNEGFAPFKDAAKPAPRGHRAKGEGLPGASFYEPLRRSVEKAGKLLVADPFKYTFARPVGDFDYKVGTAQMPK